METNPSPRAGMPILVIVLLALIASFHLGSALAGKPLFRAMHLGTALEYAGSGIDLLHPTIVGFNANGTPTAEEFPLWQAAAALVFKITNSRWYGWANVVSLSLFLTSLWPFFRLARSHLGEEAAWWALVFFLAEPLIAIMAGFGSTDGFSLTTIIWFIYFAEQMIRTGRLVWWFATASMAILAAVSKLPFFMSAGLGMVFLLLMQRVRSWRAWLALALVGLVATLAFGVWTWHAGQLAGQAEFPYYELRLSRSSQISFWYFGDLHTRLEPRMWLKGGWRFLHGTLGSPVFVVPLIAGLLQRGNPLAKTWLLGCALTTLVFTHVVLVHWHYYLMCCPAVALLCGATLARWEAAWRAQLPQRWIRLGLAGTALALSAIDGVVAMKISIFFDAFPARMAALLREHTAPTDKLIVYGGFWGGEELFRAGRKGFYIYSLENLPGAPTMKGLYQVLNSDADLGRLRAMGYNKLVLMSESPVRFAVEASNPASQRQRILYPGFLPEKARSWPVVFQSEDLLIKTIP